MKTLLQRALVLTGLLGALAAQGCQSQQTFDSPEDAVSALERAAVADDKPAMRRIFGPNIDDLRSGDEYQDELDIAAFKRSLAESSALQREGDERATLLVGDVRWPFAVPLVRDGDAWRFDTDAGAIELENRRIGRNEIRTIETCRALFDAQNEYRSRDRDGDGVPQYADRLLSSPGKKDGLYWPAPGGVDASPIGPVLAEAATRTDDSGERLPYYGFRYRLIESQGPGARGGAMNYRDEQGRLVRGWAVIAWPDEWDVTGVMTFMVSHEGYIYERDLGPDTDSAAKAVSTYDPTGWTLAGARPSAPQ